MPHYIFDIERATCGFKAAFSLTLFLIAGQINTPTAAAQYRFDHWTTGGGLPHNTINSILQTRDGYLWLATSDGLARFDGARFKVFNRGVTPGIEANRFYSLYEDRDGALWAGSEGALLQYSGGRFKTYTTSDGLPNDDIARIEGDANGDLWLGGLRKSVTLRRNGRFTNYDMSECLHVSIAETTARNGLWWSQHEDGLHIFLSGHWLTLTRRNGLPNFNVVFVSRDQRGRLLIGSGAGAALADSGATPQGLQSGGFWRDDRNGAGWYGGGRGLRRELNGATEIFPDVHGASFTFYEDREGSLWIGTTEGLYRAREVGIAAMTQKEGLPSDLIYRPTHK